MIGLSIIYGKWEVMESYMDSLGTLGASFILVANDV
jgi:hypothetical protein